MSSFYSSQRYTATQTVSCAKLTPPRGTLYHLVDSTMPCDKSRRQDNLRGGENLDDREKQGCMMHQVLAKTVWPTKVGGTTTSQSTGSISSRDGIHGGVVEGGTWVRDMV